jgi:hypothetical protein
MQGTSMRDYGCAQNIAIESVQLPVLSNLTLRISNVFQDLRLDV